MKTLTQITRWFVGLLFIFSGMVKTVDPIGFSYKLEEYFSPDVFNIPFLQDLALPLSVFFVIFEVMLGVFLILGIYKRFTLTSLLLLMIFFLFLTFYSAYYDKVTDCGCFGDAIKLTPWESFYKDLILLAGILFLIANAQYIRPLFDKGLSQLVVLVSFIIAAFVAYQGIYYLPIKDFRPYAVGNNIQEGMKTAEELGLPQRVETVNYTLQDTLTGETVSLSEEDYLGNKKYWEKGNPYKTLKTENKVIQEGYEPPIHDFYIDCPDSGDMTYTYLEYPKLVMIISSNSEQANPKGLQEVSKLAQSLSSTDIPVVNISTDDVLVDNLPTCLMDGTTLKTIIRSNPGILVLRNGTILAKYSWRKTPSAEEVEKLFNE